MSNFYARYVPPGKSEQNPKQKFSAPEKRKHVEEPRQPERSRKKQKQQLPKNLKEVEQLNDIANDERPSITKVRPSNTSATNGENLLDKYKVTAVARAHDVSGIKVRKAETPQSEESETQMGEKKRQKSKASKNESEHAINHEDKEASDGQYKKRHSAVLSKFSKAVARKPALNTDQEALSLGLPEDVSHQTYGLEPIPQPVDKDTVPISQIYSTLPAWQAHATKVVPSSRPKFELLPISEIIQANLKKYGLEYAFPIQSTVIPLLSNGPEKHVGDLCVSAATGSGKTLGYVVPLIEALKDRISTKLRGLIVVPTRELVQQVRQLCEVCSAGTNLNIATAVGNRSLSEEQTMLIEEEDIYDPVEYEKRERAGIDWSTFSISDLLRDMQGTNALESVRFVKRYKSKVDILITTPGRLVDHLRSTRGFTLDNVKWLVVDEADRLLNESYQEWAEMVIPALKSETSTADRDEILRYMRMTPPKRSVRKVLLSATMTKDISKLNSLDLNNPKLVVLGSTTTDEILSSEPTETVNRKAGSSVDGKGHFHLPSTLSECVIPVKDGSEKPLYLLCLLEKHVIQNQQRRDKEEEVSQDSQSSASTSDSDLSLASSSSLDTTSDSESGSDSESETSSSPDSTPANAKSFLLPHRPAIRTKTLTRSRALIFTRSTSSAMRLSRLLTFLSPSLANQISTLTRNTTSSAGSRRAFSSFRNGRTSILIATDRASRGLDLPDLEHVISYDVPNSALTYVHRVGRTARAGKKGQAWTLVEHREGAWFWREIGGKEADSKASVKGTNVQIQRNERIRRMNLTIDDEKLKESYEEALKKLGEEVKTQ